MNNIASMISEIVGIAPVDLVNFYFKNEFVKNTNLLINILNFQESLKYSQRINRIPVARRLGLWTLDDANNPNPFCYICKGPCTGLIILFSHDPEPEICFSSLEAFLNAIKTIAGCNKTIDNIAFEKKFKLPLNSEIFELCQENSEDSTFLICLYLQVSDILPNETKTILLNHEDFFVREAFAKFLVNEPKIEDLIFAEKLSQDPISQVAKPGKLAKSNINKIRYRV